MDHLSLMNSMSSMHFLSRNMVEGQSLGHSTERRIKKPSGLQHFGLKKSMALVLELFYYIGDNKNWFYLSLQGQKSIIPFAAISAKLDC